MNIVIFFCSVLCVCVCVCGFGLTFSYCYFCCCCPNKQKWDITGWQPEFAVVANDIRCHRCSELVA
ncbi:hypothetical protein BpHYR1_025453 [Brachionus plicatilis]|uniref:Secreted protein n=1 Tax=Brachionus plicatilis TaxID=10195 RepID=A0A3M7PZS9_BRAPC|nr:hypothetical protein BpHYR1_025453 [Brachionus plicatilis]